MESCLYEGAVHHERLTPVNHRFQCHLYLAYLDLAELPDLVRLGLVSQRRFAAASFLRRDHIGDPRQSLAESVREIVQAQTGLDAKGPIRVLTQLRTFGYHFSPLTMYYCFAPDGAALQSMVAVVQNTPWLERHAYVLWDGNRESANVQGRYRHAKAFHVSPFMSMDVEYRWRLGMPGEGLGVAIDNVSASRILFRAGLQLQRRPLSRPALRRMLVRYPFMTARITASIYYQAFQLWRRKCPFHSHPKHLPQSAALTLPSVPAILESSSVSAGAA